MISVTHKQFKLFRIVILSSAVVIYCGVSLDHLNVIPPVGQDEPWIAAAPYKFATEGVFGSDLFKGYYGMEQHNFQPPLYPILLAGVFKIAGMGVFQMRILPVMCGLTVLVMTFLVGRQIGGASLGLIAIILLISLRLTASVDQTGIPLLDLGRINRSDIAVPLLGLLAFWLFNRTEDKERNSGYFWIGMLIGLSCLCHLYGAFWMPALLLVLLIRRGRKMFQQRDAYLMVGGFLIILLPWIIYITSNWADYVGQMRLVADRFDLLDLKFYIQNLIHEIDRYRFIDMFDDDGSLYLTRPGMWAAVIGTPIAACIVILRKHLWLNKPIFALSVALITQTFLFATLLKQKHFNYMIALWPMSILLLSWLALFLWNFSKSLIARKVLLVIFILILIEGGLRIAHHHKVAIQTTPYNTFEQEIANHIPFGSRILALHHYWLGLYQYDYRTWLLPFLFSDARYYSTPLTFQQALERINPDVVLVDRYMSQYFDEIADQSHPQNSLYKEYQQYMKRHAAELIKSIEDKTYGRMHIYQLTNGDQKLLNRRGS